MKIARYHEIKGTNLYISQVKGRYKLNPTFNLANSRGEIIVLMGSRQSCQTWLRNIFLERQTFQKQKIASAGDSLQLRQDPDTLYPVLSPVQSIYSQVNEVVQNQQGYLGFNQKRNLTESYLTAAGLQAYRNLTPIQVPRLIIQQTKLALLFATGQGVVLLDYLFDSLDTPEKGLLLMSLLNLQDSEKEPRTVIYATQHLEDAIFMGDRILVLNPLKLGVVAENLSVWLPRPRNRQNLKSLPSYKALLKLVNYLLTDALAVEDQPLHKCL